MCTLLCVYLSLWLYILALGAQSRSSGNGDGLSPLAYAGYLANADISNTDLMENCPSQPECSELMFRTADGSCNNQKNPKYGMSATPLKRLMPSKYDDGMSFIAYI